MKPSLPLPGLLGSLGHPCALGGEGELVVHQASILVALGVAGEGGEQGDRPAPGEASGRWRWGRGLLVG